MSDTDKSELGKEIDDLVLRDGIRDIQVRTIGVHSNELTEAIQALITQQRNQARIDELAQNFLDTDETCMVDVGTKQPITVKQRKDYLYEKSNTK